MRRRRADSVLVERLEARTMLSAGADTAGQDMLNVEVTPTISFPDFSDPSGLTLVGNATAPAVNSNVLRLTNAFRGQAGAAWYTAEKQFVSVDWETTFDFNLNENRSAFDDVGGADGFVFIVQNHSSNFLNSDVGPELGYQNLRNSLAVEFDTNQRGDISNDPSHSHISVHTNGTGPNGADESLSLGLFNTPSLMDDAATHTARISYTPGTLSVYLDDLTSPVLTVEVNLARLLDLDADRAWVGFTASTGVGWQNHDILNWDYRVLVDPSTRVAINDVSVDEGDAGTTDFTFTVTRSGDTTGTTTVDWVTADGTATAASGDYLDASGQVTFAPGETEQTITISVNRDVVIEGDETFLVELSSISGGSTVDDRGMGTIVNDDGPTVFVDNFTKIAHETNGGPALADQDAFGGSVTSLGDLDGDGITDMAIGAREDDTGGTDRGAVYVQFMNADGTVRSFTKIGHNTGGGPMLADDDWFGSSVAALGDLDGDGVTDLAVGAINDDTGGTDRGAVHVLFLNADGTVKSRTKIAHNTGGGPTLAYRDRGFFGSSVALLGDLDGDGISDLAVGARKDFDAVIRGAVYVLFLNADGTVKSFTEIGHNTGGGPMLARDDWFGSSVAALGDLDGDGVTELAVGAFGSRRGGAVHVLYLNADGTAKRTTKIASDAGGGPTLADGDFFGIAVATMGDLDRDGVTDLSVGAFRDDTGGTERGAVYMLYLNVDGTVKSFTKIASYSGGGPTLTEGDLFGISLASLGDLDGDGTIELAVGATGDDTGAGGRGERGALYILSLNTGPAILPNAPSIAEGNAGTTDLVFTVSRRGGSAEPVTIDWNTADGTATAGSDYVAASGTLEFLQGETSKTISVQVIGDSHYENDESLFVHLALVNSSATLVDNRTQGTILNDDPLIDSFTKIAHEDFDPFGSSVASLGDLDGDGVTDLAVGAGGDGNGRGAVHVLYLNADGTVKSTTKIASDTNGGPTLADGDRFGGSVASLGDLDGDGVTDLAVGAAYDDTGGMWRGALYVLFLNADGTAKSFTKIAHNTGGGPMLADRDWFGSSVASLGDLDGDGITEVAVGATGDDNPGRFGRDNGAVYVLFLNFDGTIKNVTKIAHNTGGGPTLTSDDFFGWSLTSLGDLDGDGITDLAVGANYSEVYVILLNADGTAKSFTMIDDNTGGGPTLADGDEFGTSVASLGDLDGDGVTELAVGVTGDDTGGGKGGALYVLFLNADGTAKSFTKIAHNTGGGPMLANGDRFGYSVASLGDLDGDGVTELAVGVRSDAVYVLFLNVGPEIDTTAPSAPVLTGITEDTGTAGDQVTSDQTLALSGTAEANSTVTLSRSGEGIIGQTTADGAGDWSFDDTGTTLPEGLHTFTATATDTAGNTSVPSDEFTVEIDLTAPMILDDGDAGYSDTGDWEVSPAVEGRDGDVRFAPAGNGSRVATYEFSGLTPGVNYEVAATWTAHANRATDAPYTILNSDGVNVLETTFVNQELAPDDFSVDGSDWEKLGVVTVSGTTLTVQLSNAADQYVIADALRVVKTTEAPPEVIVIDDGEDGYADTGWAQSPMRQGFRGDLRYAGPGNGSKTATWTFTGLDPGYYRVSATWAPHPNRATNAPFTILDGAGGDPLATTIVNQELAPDDFIANGCAWEDLAVVTISGSELVLELTNAANEYVIADAIRIERSLTGPPPPEFLIIDDGDTGYTDTGWEQSPVMQGRLNDLRYQSAGNGSQTATWTFTGLTPGSNYAVAATWDPHPNRATNAPFTIYSGLGGDVLEQVLVNQELAPNDFTASGSSWEHLAIVAITGTELVVELSNDANQYVIADAIRIAPTTDVPVLQPGTIIDDGEDGFSTTVSGWSTSPGEGRDGDVRYTGSGSGSRIATWMFTDLASGTYRVSATWTTNANRATNAPYTVLDGTTSLGTVAINQEQAPDDFITQGSDWEDLMEVEITGDTLVVELSNNGNGFVIADAIRVQAVT